MAKVYDTGFRLGPKQSNGGQVVIEGDRIRQDPEGNIVSPGTYGGGRVVPRPAGFPGSPADSPRDTR
jgi:hypothetical protein